MAGERHLWLVRASMRPRLRPGVYVYVTAPDATDKFRCAQCPGVGCLA